MNTKSCSRCGSEFPATTDFFHRGDCKYGLKSFCKLCASQKFKDYRVKNRDRINGKQKQTRAQNPEKVRAQDKKYRESHPDKRREQIRRWMKKNASKRRDYQKNWWGEHPEKRREYERNRRAKKKGADGTHCANDVARQYKSQKGKCWWCGKPVKWEERHDDHLVPLSRGGTNSPGNIVVSCAYCNLSKHDKLPHEFAGKLF